MLFTALYVLYRDLSYLEVTRVYPELPHRDLQFLFWGVLYLECSYCAVYYMLGYSAICHVRTFLFRAFALVAGVGIAAQVVLAYMNSFNLRMTGYIYGKFLGNLRRSIDLIPETVSAV